MGTAQIEGSTRVRQVAELLRERGQEDFLGKMAPELAVKTHGVIARWAMQVRAFQAEGSV